MLGRGTFLFVSSKKTCLSRNDDRRILERAGGKRHTRENIIHG